MPDKNPSLRPIRNIYTALSKEHCLTIFDLLHEKPLRSKDLFNACHCTKREYYLALNTLQRSKLIERLDGKYAQTYLGAYIYSNQIYTWKAIQHTDKFELYSKVNGVLKQSSSEQALELSAIMIKNLETSLGTSALEPVVIYSDWDNLSRDLFPFIEGAKSEILIANRILDPNTVAPLLRIAKAGKKVRVLNDIKLIDQRIKLASIDPNISALFKALFSTPGIEIRVLNLSYSFVIVDQLELGIEIVNPIRPSEFFIGYRFRSATLAEMMASFFRDMWEVSKEYNISMVGDQFARTFKGSI